MPTKIALVGIGKIALDQHVPALNASPDWELAATISRSGKVEGIPAWTDFATFLRERPDIPVVSLCMPPVPRYTYAEAALEAGRHVMLEKPPGATLAEVHALETIAKTRGLSLYATWHSRMAHAVAPAKAWLADKTIRKAHITWREDVRKWHPGQDWVFEPGGMGVFDPGINALSILTDILPKPVHLTKATLEFPANRQTPIAAQLIFDPPVIRCIFQRQMPLAKRFLAFKPQSARAQHRAAPRCARSGHRRPIGALPQHPAAAQRTVIVKPVRVPLRANCLQPDAREGKRAALLEQPDRGTLAHFGIVGLAGDHRPVEVCLQPAIPVGGAHSLFSQVERSIMPMAFWPSHSYSVAP